MRNFDSLFFRCRGWRAGLLLGWLLLGCSGAWGQQLAALRGTITDSLAGQPLPGVRVAVPGHATVTDALGQFRLTGLPAGPVQVQLGEMGYKAKIQVITLVAGETRGFAASLAATSLDLAEVTVSQPADPNQTLATISHIDQTLRPVNSAQDLLRLVPGLFIAQHAGGGKAEQIFVRGFDADHGTDFAVSLDGLPVNMVSHAHGQGYADFHFVIPETVEQLKIYKGPYTARFGDFATAGAGEFSTKNSLDRSQVKLELGQFDTRRALVLLDLLGTHHLLSRRPENLYVASEYYFTNSYFDNPQGFKRFNGMGKYVGQLSERTSLTLFGSYFNSSWYASGQVPERAVSEGLISRFGSIDPSEGGNTNRTNAYAILTTGLGGEATLRQQVYYTRYNFNLYSNFTFFKNDPVNGDEINQRDTGRDIWGYTGTYDRRDQLGGSRVLHSTLGLGTRLDGTDLLLQHVARRVPLDTLSIGRLYEQNVNAYLDETLELTDRLTVNAAVRGDVFIFNFRGQHADSARAGGLGPFGGRVVRGRVSPKLNFYYQLAPQVQLFLRSGLGFHSNDARGVVQGTGGFNALPRAAGAELGTTAKPLPSLVLNAAFWTLHLQDELVYSGDEGTTESVGPTQRFGLDVSARWQLTGWLFADVDLNYSHGRLTQAAEGENYIPLAPTFTSTGGLSVRAPGGLSGSLRYRHIDSRPAQEDNAIRAKGYFLLDAVLNYTRPRFQVGLQAQNLLNVKWNEAQFATDSQLRGEATSVNELNFTPGTPFYLKGNVSLFF